MEKDKFYVVLTNLILPLFTGSILVGEEESSARESEIALGKQNSILIKPNKAADYRFVIKRGRAYQPFEISLLKNIIKELSEIEETAGLDPTYELTLQEKAIEKALALAGYNLFVTSEIHMPDLEVYHTYHNLWRIEESFRIMKSQLDARPVYLQKEDTITGHFLICYLAVLLTRLLQFKVLGEQYCSEDILNFFKQFRAARVSERKYINLTRNSTFIREFAQKTNLPLTSYFLTESQIKKMLSHRF